MTIQELITACGTREQAAQITGTHRVTIYRWLRGVGRPDWLNFQAMCSATGVDPMTITDTPQASEPKPNNLD